MNCLGCLQNCFYRSFDKKYIKIAYFWHIAYHASYHIYKKFQNQVSYFLHFCLREAKVARRIQYKPTHVHRTRAYIKKKMTTAEQENNDLREEVSNLKEGIEKITAMMINMMAAHA